MCCVSSANSKAHRRHFCWKDRERCNDRTGGHVIQINQHMARSCFIMGALLLILLLPACSKSHSPQPSVTGQWRLVQVVNMIGYNPTTIDSSNEIVTLQLGLDSSYTKTNAGILTETGTYSIAFLPSRSVADTMISFRPVNNNTYNRVLRLNGLQLSLHGVDAYEVYHRQ